MRDITTAELCAVATPGQWKRHDTADYAEIHFEVEQEADHAE